MINHDPKTADHQLDLEKTSSTLLKKEKLANGEYLPTLEEYLIKGKECQNIKLILELKPHNNKEREDSLTAKVLAMVKDLNLENKVEYISFSLNTVKELIRLKPNAKVYYLNGDRSSRRVGRCGADRFLARGLFGGREASHHLTLPGWGPPRKTPAVSK